MAATTITHNTKTILLFGDQTDPWIDDIDQLYKQAVSTPWLQAFLDELSWTMNTEVKAIMLDPILQDSLGHFSSLKELSERYRHNTDELGMARSLLIYAMRAANLLQWVNQDPNLLKPGSRPEWLGISGGLISLSPLAISKDFNTLYDACIEVARLLVRACKFTSMRSRAMEDRPGVWGWAVLGISPDELRTALDQFQQAAGIPSIKRGQVAVTGAGWNTIVGPPSVLELFIKQCPAVRTLAKNPLNIHALLHTANPSPDEVDYIVGQNSNFLDKPLICSNQDIWGMDDPSATYATWGDMLRAICLQLLSCPLDLTLTVGRLCTKLSEVDIARIIPIGTSCHTPYLAGALRTGGKVVSIQDQQSFIRENLSLQNDRIAIVGMAGRGPGCDNADQLWELIMAKQDLCREIPEDRFKIDEFYCDTHGKGGKCTMTTRYGCFMDNPGNFDARFFHISPREAMVMHPGHRQFLMSSYEALEMAGYSDGRTQAIDPTRIAVFHGQCSDDWYNHSHPTLGCDAYTLQGQQRAFGSGRVAWQFNWEGPTYSLDSACASSTSCIHLACISLLSKDIDMAVAGASNILSYPHAFNCLSKAGVLSDSGNCKTFRDDADGYSRGDFVGAVVLKRLEDAVAHNDNILAVVAASGRNHSGNSTSITTSDAGAQERLLQKLFRNAQVSPNDISYVEVHGTGTQIGDPAEIGALSSFFKHRHPLHGPVALGGVKANFGHSEAAAGLAELLKCVMIFQKKTIPPQVGMPHALNPKFPSLSTLNMEIPSEPRTFDRTSDGRPRRILLSNFDAAGGNACLLLEDYHAVDNNKYGADPRSYHVIVTSARTQASHQVNKRRLIEWLRGNSAVRVQDVAYTTTARRMHHPIRFACAAATIQELIKNLEADVEMTEMTSPLKEPPIVFVFTGQGSHYAGMGSDLYDTSPIFRETVNLCVGICGEHGFPPFLDLITDNSIDMSTKTSVQTQLAVITLEIGLITFWKSVGVHPSIVMGHSLGEYTALYAAGVLSLSDVLYLVGQRALLILERCDADTSAMLAVPMSSTTTDKFLKNWNQSSSCAVACINSPTATVISGSTSDIAQLQAELTTPSKVLSVPYAFHSSQMDPILADYASLAEGVTFSEPKMPVASTLLGSIIETSGLFTAHYLEQQTRQPVDFIGALNAISLKLADPIWLELGPGYVCSSFIRSTLSPSYPSKKIMSTLDKTIGGRDWMSISKCITAVYMQGVTIDWAALHAPYTSCLKMVTLPSYAWDLKSYWVTYTEASKAMRTSSPSTGTVTKQHSISTCAQYIVNQSSSSIKIDVTLGAFLADPALCALIDGHRMQHEPICTGSIFCEAALATTMYALETNGRKDDAMITRLRLQNPNMTRPLTRNLVDLDGELLTTVTMENKSTNEILVSWKASGQGISYDLGTCKLTIYSNGDSLQADWGRLSYFIKAKMDEVIRAAKEGRGHRFQPNIFYALFDRTVEYSRDYQSIKDAFVSSDFAEAVAEVSLQEHPIGTRFVASPYWAEGITQLAGFTVNSNPQNVSGTSFINSGFEKFEQTTALEAGKSYFSYVRVSHQDKESRTCDVFVFNSNSKLIAQCCGLHFHQISNDTLRQVVSGKSKPPGQPKNDLLRESPSEITPPMPKKSNKLSRKNEKGTSLATPGVLQIMLEIISDETGIAISELTDDAIITDLGVDSIMAIEVASKVSAATSLELLPSFLIEHHTIGALRRTFGSSSPLTTSTQATTPKSSASSPPESSASSMSGIGLDSDYVVVKECALTPAAEVNENQIRTIQQQDDAVEDSSPQPRVRITLLHGRPYKTDQDAQGAPPFYVIADGTGTIATYIHLTAHIRSNIAFYGIDSPFLRCPSRLTLDVGIPGTAKLIVEALIKKQPKGVPFWIGGFSGGAMIAYEVCRQLSAAGYEVDSLLLIDMCSPRQLTGQVVSSDIGVPIMEAMSRQDESGVWDATGNTTKHLRSVFAAVAAYHPPLPPKGQSPVKRTAIIWARKGMIQRCSASQQLMDILTVENIPIKAYPGFMEDPRLGAVAWGIPNKTNADLGANGWDRYVDGDTLVCSSIEADHLEMPTPGYAHLLGEAIEQAFDHFRRT
ncbi:ketoacyl-synt-domain-containing protein [Lojkania enalia]|uniref:Ketoacyl-synt-domain-containing protein n=1 Tax=Lojkania enalia TaxID=147567 RepID=A0A9P4JWV0_9PLEO|nr:ketoacyl-synt-domain-containing protein [Didymosphaeria enalia]